MEMNTQKDGFTTMLVRLSTELKERIDERADDELVAVNALAVMALEKYLAEPVSKGKLSAQHALARQILPLIFSAESEGRALSYKALARELRRPDDHARAIGQACDLIDAASVLADVPLIALWRVKTATGEHNPRAFANHPAFRRELLDQARRHVFTEADQRAIEKELGALRRKGNHAAWRFVEAQRPDFVALRDAETAS